MARGDTSLAKRTRVSVDLPPETRRGLRLAASLSDVSVGRYVLEAIEDGLREDLASEGLLTFNAQTDPVLAELWNNASDSAYDRA